MGAYKLLLRLDSFDWITDNICCMARSNKLVLCRRMANRRADRYICLDYLVAGNLHYLSGRHNQHQCTRCAWQLSSSLETQSDFMISN